ncbi:MAG: glucose-6-phosphate isomerase [Planctomycetes bacterium]|nr:glucose-6-phosphate isomerase [Planctomycetota bacterium]
MANSNLRLYWKNVTAAAIGKEHGITPAAFRKLAGRVRKAVARVNQEREAGATPYRDLPRSKKHPQAVKDMVAQVRNGCENLVVLGIGGSALGNIALQTALNSPLHNLDEAQRQGPRLFVLDNIDPVQFGAFLKWAEKGLDRTVWNVISKSGETAETAAQFMIVRQMLLNKLGHDGYRRQVIATTDVSRGVLRRISANDGLRTLVVPEGVGGRFSVLSPVGLFSAAMCGIDIDLLLAGARAMDARVKSEDLYANPAAMIAALNCHYYQERGKNIAVMMPYSFQLKDLTDWYRQLWAESLGKAQDRKGRAVHVGPTPVNALGATDQHSQIQLYREGPNDKLFTFLEVERFSREITIGPAPAGASEVEFLAGKTLGALLNSEKQASEYALLINERPCLTIVFPEITAYTVGQFIYLYEVATSIAGVLLDVNPYDQPAVELGKEVTRALEGKPGADYEDLAREVQSPMKKDREYLV